jgi:hypothetical protein
MYVARIFFCEEIEDNTVDDEIDELFSKLEQIEPPLSLIEDILATVAQLPPPQFLTPVNDLPTEWGGLRRVRPLQAGLTRRHL